MKAGFVLLLLAACSAGDDASTGARAECAFGGELVDCPDSARTSEGACWRLVDCGSLAVNAGDDNNRFDWGTCVDGLDGTTEDRRRLIINCIAASTCDDLRSGGQNSCLGLGGN